MEDIIELLEEETLRKIKMNYHPKSATNSSYKLDDIRRRIEKHFHMLSYDYKNLDDDYHPTVTIKCEECYEKALTRIGKHKLRRERENNQGNIK